MRSVDLVGERQPPHLPAVRAGQVVQVSGVQFCLEPGPFPSGVCPIRCRPRPIRRRPSPIGGCLSAEPFHLVQDRRIRLGGAPDLSGRTRFARPTEFVAGVSSPIALGGCRITVDCRVCAFESVTETLERGSFPLVAGIVVGTLFRRGPRPGGAIAICGVLVVIRGALIALGAGLICRRGGLVRVGEGLISVGRRLVRISGRLICVDRSPCVLDRPPASSLRVVN